MALGLGLGLPFVIMQMIGEAVPETEAPGQVTGLSAGTTTTSSVPLSWVPPSTGGFPSDYIVEYKLDSSPTWLVFDDGASSSTEAVVTGLSDSSLYNFRVKATNIIGDGAYSDTVSATTAAALAPPGDVTGLSAGTTTTSSVPLSWTAPSSGGAVDNYVVEYKQTSSGTWIEFGLEPTTSETVTGLASSTSYDFRVKARNAAGDGGYDTITGISTAASGGTGDFLLINGSGDRLLINGSGDKLKAA